MHATTAKAILDYTSRKSQMPERRTSATRRLQPAKSFSPSGHPLVYEVNARVLVNELSTDAGKRLSLASIPDRVIDEWESCGFEALWLMGVWTTGEIGLQIARNDPTLRDEYKKVLPDFSDKDVIGSPYAVKSYTVSTSLGGKAALASFRKRLAKKGMGLILDFVSNHTARDHSWVTKHPEYYVNGVEGDAVASPDRFFVTKTAEGQRILANGRDPYFPGWTDTVQLNIRHPLARQSMIREIRKIATQCDGVRCDMAMLILQEVFEKTWGELSTPSDVEPATGEFWTEAIEAVHRDSPSFLLIAEAYWDLEWRLQQLGFDFTYDKALYDRLLREGAGSVYKHLKAEAQYQAHALRFLENHDEPRAAHSLPNEAWHCAAATVAATVPGMFLLHEGQLEGKRIKLPVQLGRRPSEPVSEQVKSFYQKLLASVGTSIFKNGEWDLLHVKPAWNDNQTWRDFLAFWWHEKAGGSRLVVVNYAPQNGQCYVEINLDEVSGSRIEFRDMLGEASYVRDKATLRSKGMYFDLPSYGIHIFDVNPV